MLKLYLMMYWFPILWVIVFLLVGCMCLWFKRRLFSIIVFLLTMCLFLVMCVVGHDEYILCEGVFVSFERNDTGRVVTGLYNSDIDGDGRFIPCGNIDVGCGDELVVLFKKNFDRVVDDFGYSDCVLIWQRKCRVGDVVDYAIEGHVDEGELLCDFWCDAYIMDTFWSLIPDFVHSVELLS